MQLTDDLRDMPFQDCLLVMVRHARLGWLGSFYAFEKSKCGRTLTWTFLNEEVRDSLRVRMDHLLDLASTPRKGRCEASRGPLGWFSRT